MLLKQINEQDFLKIGRLFSTHLGKDVLEILNNTFYNTVSFTPGQPDVGAFKEGQRDLVQIFRSAVRAAENMNKETNNE